MGDDEFVRSVHIDDYDVELGRFQSSCFSVSSDDKGISVFCAACAESSSGSVCNHLRSKYASITNSPPIFWQFKRSDLPSSVKLVQKTENDDICHHNIFGLPDRERRKFVRGCPIDKFQICAPSGLRIATQEILSKMKNMLAI